MFTFLNGPLRNTLIECDSCPSNVNMTGGRIEECNTLISYRGGTYNSIGRVVIRGVDFDATNVYNTTANQVTTYYTKAFPLIDDTLNGVYPNTSYEQFMNTIEQCRFNGNSSAPFPALSLVGYSGDNSRTYFDRCTFGGFSNLLTDPAPHIDPVLDASLAALNVKVTQCRANTGQAGSAPFTDISYP